MSRSYSLAYLSSHRCTPAQAVAVAARQGYEYVGLRPWPNAPGGPQQHLLDDQQALRETLSALRDTGVRVFDLEIIRIGEDFQLHRWDALYELGAALGARAFLVAGDDPDLDRLAQHYAALCDRLAPLGMTADLEFMPWTPVTDARTALEVVLSAGSPQNAGILVDALHFGRSATTLTDLRALPRQWLHYAQVCDAPPGAGLSVEEMIHTARCARLFPGEGCIDIPGMLDNLPADIPLSVEVIHLEREQQATPDAWAAQALARARQIAEPA